MTELHCLGLRAGAAALRTLIRQLGAKAEARHGTLEASPVGVASGQEDQQGNVGRGGV